MTEMRNLVRALTLYWGYENLAVSAPGSDLLSGPWPRAMEGGSMDNEHREIPTLDSEHTLAG